MHLKFYLLHATQMQFVLYSPQTQCSLRLTPRCCSMCLVILKYCPTLIQYVTQFAKTQHDIFLEIQIFASVSFIYMYLKLCSVVISMLCWELQGSFLLWLILHAFNYTIITCGYFNIQSWDKDYSTQHEMVIPNTKTNYRKRAIKCLKMLK